ncbi:MAG: hypothetical protein ACREMN_04495 [Gemmatimonadales bacterium]
MRRSWSVSALLGAAALGVLAQGPGTRLTYRVRIFEHPGTGAGTPRLVGSGSVSGAMDTRLRLSLRTDSAQVEALLHLTPAGDSVSLGAEFFTRRRVARSRRGLPLWEQDTYRRAVRMAWTDTARIVPFGRAAGQRDGARRPDRLWVEVALERDFTGGETRPAEELQVADSLPDFRVEAVVRPRRARVILNLVRGDTVSGPRPMDLVPEGPARTVRLVLAGRATVLSVRLTRPEPPRMLRDRVLALDADVVCLRVASVSGAICGRLNNVARRLPLPAGDTLLATFAWPGSR